MDDLERRLSIKNINNATPPFPCVAIGFSKMEGNNAFDLHTFQTQAIFDHYRRGTMAAVRVLLRLTDFADVPATVIDLLLAKAFPEKNPDTEQLELLFIDRLRAVAQPYEERLMTETATAEPENSTEAKAAAKAAAAKARDAAKEATKKERESKRADGVIGTIFAGLNTREGATVEETLNTLVDKFPQRTRDGMASTVKIQFSRLAKSKNREIINENIVGRGRVYKFKDLGKVQGEIVVPKPKPKSEPATPTETGEPGEPMAQGKPVEGEKTKAAAPATKNGTKKR